MSQNILLEVNDRIATITLNRPETSNAIAEEMYGEIGDLYAACDAREDVGCIVITGAGKHFCAGGDIAGFKKMIDRGELFTAEGIGRTAGALAEAVRMCSKPTIAMINGVATGAGLGLAMSCDMRIATPSSKFIAGFVKLGLSGDTACQYLLQQLVGVAKATELMMTGRPVGGEEAERLGLVTRLAEEGALVETTMALAAQLAHAPLLAIRLQKEMIRSLTEEAYRRSAQLECEYMEQCGRHPDFAEAVNAFLEKRPPVFGK